MLQIGERRREFEKQQQKRGLIMNVSGEKNFEIIRKRIKFNIRRLK